MKTPQLIAIIVVVVIILIAAWYFLLRPKPCTTDADCKAPKTCQASGTKHVCKAPPS